MLVNKEQVGGIGGRADDVLVLGDCDDGVRRIAEACGWLGELEGLWAGTKKGEEGEIGMGVEGEGEKEGREKKGRDERLQDEVEALTREVEESLRLGEEQRRWVEGYEDVRIARKVDDDEKEEDKKEEGEWQVPKGDEVDWEKEGLPKERGKLGEKGAWLEGHLEGKKERIAEKDVEKKDAEGGLGHVFPHLDKKSSL